MDSIDDAVCTMWVLLSVQFAAEVKAFVGAHVIDIDLTIGELLCEHLIALRSEAKEDGSGIGPEFPSAQKGLSSVGEGAGTHELVQLNDGSNKEVSRIYGPMDNWSYGLLIPSYLKVANSFISIIDASLDKEKGDDRVVRSEILLKEVVGKNVALFKFFELNLLRRLKLNFQRLLQYHENDSDSVIMYECQKHLVAVLHRKMIDMGSVVVTKRMLKRQELSLKCVFQCHEESFVSMVKFEFEIHSVVDNNLKMISNSIYGNVFKLTSQVYLAALKGYERMRCSSDIGYVEVGALVASILALLVNHILSSHVINLATSFLHWSLLNICCCYFHPTDPILANGRNMVFVVYSPLALKLGTTPLYAIYNPSTKSSLIFFQHVELKVVLHRKMIYKGNFLVAKVLVKWNGLTPKHGALVFEFADGFVIVHAILFLHGSLLKSREIVLLILEDKDV